MKVDGAQDFIIQKRLRETSYQRSFLVYDQKRRIPVILKQFPITFNYGVMSGRISQRLKTLENLSHPNILRIYEIARNPDSIVLIREFQEGNSLAELFSEKNGRRWDDERITDIFFPLCTALVYAHKKGIYHGALHPGNVIVGQGRNVWISDFAVFPALHPEAYESFIEYMAAYVAPELDETKIISPLADIYALGVLLYQARSGGRYPFDGSRVAKLTGSAGIIFEAKHLPPQPFPESPAPLSQVLDEVILKCIEKAPRNRPQSVGEIVSILLAIKGGQKRSLFVSKESVPSSGNQIIGGSKITAQRVTKLWKQTWVWIAGFVLFSVIILWLALNIIYGLDTRFHPAMGNAPGNVITLSVEKTFPTISPITFADLSVGNYPLQVCMTLQEIDGVALSFFECISGIEILDNRFMRVYITWSVSLPYNIKVEHLSDEGNQNMYITDQAGVRYDQQEAGGAAGQYFLLESGEQQTGWFLFPPLADDAVYFIFHDDDNLIQTEPIYFEKVRE